MIKLTDSEFEMIVIFVRMNYGLNLEKKRFLIESKLWIELARCKVDNYSDYWLLLLSDKSGIMKQRMIDLLTINYTYFCREEDHFKYLSTVVLDNLRNEDMEELTIWCAGCATGQECYTLAMQLFDCRNMGLLRVPFSIIGTDISETALHAAKKASYNVADYARLSRHWQMNYCEPLMDGQFKVKEKVKDTIQFRKHNLMKPLGTYEKFHIVFCRNVLIYFKEEERNKLIDSVMKSVVPGGYLFTGHTETLKGCSVPLKYIQPAIYRKP